MKEEDFVKWFSELDKSSIKIAGGKGANLAEIYNLGVPVPPGFVVTAQAYNYFIKKAGIAEKMTLLLEKINYEDTKELDEKTKKIRILIEEAELPLDLKQEIIEAYENLDADLNEISSKPVMDILKAGAEPMFVAVRSSATAEDLADASFAGQQESYMNVKGKIDLLKHIKKCFASLFTSRATYYRNKKGFDHMKTSLAVVVQKMIDSEKSGVVFSKDPSERNNNTIIEAVWGLGEGIVSGAITPDKYVIDENQKLIDKKISNKKIAITRDSAGNQIVVKLKNEIANSQVLDNSEINKLSDFALKLENHYQKPQDIEFAIDNTGVYIVQTRAITTIEKRFSTIDIKDVKGEVILTGLAASPGIGTGIVKIVEDLKDLDKVQKGDVLITKMTNPDMVVTMQKSSAIVTDEGGLTAHAAIVSREMGIPCIVGTLEATSILKDGDVITVDGYNGKVYKGKVAESSQKDVAPVTAKTKTEIKVIVDLPSFAERASKTGLTKVGLTRIEGIIAESGKHPKYFLDNNKIKDYEEIIFKGIDGISKHFEEMWVRTSDIRTDEFQHLKGAPQEKEANPMLGLHGIRYSLKNKGVLKAELNAMERVAKKGKSIGILMPQVISVEELKEVKKILNEMNISNLKIGIMIETPAAVQQIKELCEEGIEFISFGTNDLTQFMLAIDRGNPEVQDLYNEMHPAILYQLKYVIRVCKRYNVKTSICGQAGSNKPMVKELIESGIDSISVNADAASEIAEYVSEIEQDLIKGTDKEPRKYNPEKQDNENSSKLSQIRPHSNTEAQPNSSCSTSQIKEKKSETKIIKEEAQKQEKPEEINTKEEENLIIEEPKESIIENTENSIKESIEKAGEKIKEVIKDVVEELAPDEEDEKFYQEIFPESEEKLDIF